MVLTSISGRMSSPSGCPRVYISRVISTCLLPFWEVLQDQQVGLTQALFKLLLLPWFPECVRFGVHPLKVGVSWWLSR